MKEVKEIRDGAAADRAHEATVHVPSSYRSLDGRAAQEDSRERDLPDKYKYLVRRPANHMRDHFQNNPDTVASLNDVKLGSAPAQYRNRSAARFRMRSLDQPKDVQSV